MITVTAPEHEVLAACSLPELRVCLAESRRARAVLDAVDAQIASLMHDSTVRVGSHERGAGVSLSIRSGTRDQERST